MPDLIFSTKIRGRTCLPLKNSGYPWVFIAVIHLSLEYMGQRSHLRRAVRFGGKEIKLKMAEKLWSRNRFLLFKAFSLSLIQVSLTCVYIYFFDSTSASLLVSQGSCELSELAEEW